jgi:DNA-binding YbaB/EbfC family protein
MFDKNQLANLMKKAQEMQNSMKQAQDEIAHLEITGESGAGMVKINILGNHNTKKVVIDPSLLDDKEMLEDLIVAALNDANRKLAEQSAEKMGGVTQGIPGLNGLKLPI